MRIRELLPESKSADLYHGTSLENAEQILEENRIYPGDDANISFSRDFGVAFTFALYREPAGVIFVIDQLKLSQDRGRQIRPVNRVPGYEEHEEALNSKLENASKYIKKIYVIKHTEFDEGDFPRVMSDPRTEIVQQDSFKRSGVASGYRHDMTARQFAHMRTKKQ